VNNLEETNANMKEVEQTNIEAYLQDLNHVLIPAHLIPLDAKEIEALSKSYVLSKGTPPIEEQKQILDSLAQKIDNLVADKIGKGNKFFIRISTRSPKDGMLFDPVMKKEVETWLMEWEKENNTKRDNNAILSAVYLCQNKVLARYDGKAAIELLCNSYRIHEDLVNWLEMHKENKEKVFPMSIVIREWMDLDVSREFRCFVEDKQIKGIKQYSRLIYWPKIYAQKEELGKKFKEFWEKDVHPNIQNWDLKNFMIDFGVLKDRIVVVEINPSYESYTLGGDPFAIKMNSKPLTEKEIRATIALPWKIYLGWAEESEFDPTRHFVA